MIVIYNASKAKLVNNLRSALLRNPHSPHSIFACPGFFIFLQKVPV